MENKRRNTKYGVPERDAPIDTRELADKVRGISILYARYGSLMVIARHPCFVMCREQQQQSTAVDYMVVVEVVVVAGWRKACEGVYDGMCYIIRLYAAQFSFASLQSTARATTSTTTNVLFSLSFPSPPSSTWSADIESRSSSNAVCRDTFSFDTYPHALTRLVAH